MQIVATFKGPTIDCKNKCLNECANDGQVAAIIFTTKSQYRYGIRDFHTIRVLLTVKTSTLSLADSFPLHSAAR